MRKHSVTKAGRFGIMFAMAILAMRFAGIQVHAEESGDWEYSVKDGSATIKAYRGNEKQIVIPERLGNTRVTGIGENAFAGNNDIESVNIGPSVTWIGNSAFNGCAALTSVTFSDFLTSIGTRAFSGSKIKEADLPETLEYIGCYAFENCNSLRHVTLRSAKEWGTDWGTGAAFRNCSLLTEITIGSGVSCIGSNAFENCELLEEIIIPENVESVGANAFSGCELLKKADVYGTLSDNAFAYCKSLNDMTIRNASSVGSGAFKDNTSLQNVLLPDTLTSIGTDAFSGCTKLEGIVIPDSVEYIGAYAFRNDKQLKTAVLGSGIKEWGTDWGKNHAFENCKALTDLTIKEGAAYIPQGCFLYDSALVNVVIPASVRSVNDSAFYECTQLKNVVFTDTDTEKSQLETIDKYAFCGCSVLTKADLPGNIITIGESAFHGTSLEKAIIPDKVEYIGCYAFSDCPEITEVYLGENVSSWGTDWGTGAAFRNDTAIEKVTIADGVTIIGPNAFEGCISIKSVVIPVTVKEICDFAFSGCISLTDAVIERGTVGAGAFSGCRALYHVELGRCSSIGASAFNGNTVLYEIEIPDTVTSIGESAFADCVSLREIVIPDSVTSLGAYAFSGCTSLYYAGIGNNVTSWGMKWGKNQCFAGDTSLKYVSFADGANSIGTGAFLNCTALEAVSLPKTITEWGDNIFENCPETLEVSTDDVKIREKMDTLGVRTADFVLTVPAATEKRVTISFSGNGTVSPGGMLSRAKGSTVRIALIPEAGSFAESVTVNGKQYNYDEQNIVAFKLEEDTDVEIRFSGAEQNISLSDDDLYRINLFLSNFAETVEDLHLSAQDVNVTDYINFAWRHCYINRLGQQHATEDGRYMYYTVGELNSVLDKYCGFVLSEDAIAYAYKDTIFWYEEGKIMTYMGAGDNFPYFAVVTTMNASGKNSFDVVYDIYELDMDVFFSNDGITDKYYKMSDNEAQKSADLRKVGEGKAKVETVGEKYRLISLDQTFTF